MITLVAFLLLVIPILFLAIGLESHLGFLAPLIEIGLVLLMIWAIYKVFSRA